MRKTQEETTAGETDWNNLERLPIGTLLIIEQTDGKRVKGHLMSVATDALSVHRGKAVVGVPRSGVSRVWLLGDNKLGTGALVGVVAGAIFGFSLCARTADGETGVCAAIWMPLFSGAGAGIGAAIGANVRERTLIYRAPPASPPSATTTSLVECRVHPVPVLCTSHPPPLASLPPPLREIYQNFSADQAARRLSRRLAHPNRAPGAAALSDSCLTAVLEPNSEQPGSCQGD
ncbi:MAG: hypothetical protein ACE5HL_08115 [Terriglobia bacterium]